MTIASEWPRPADILNYYQRCREALGMLRRNPVLNADSLFFGMTDQEVEQSLQQMAKELDDEVTLLLTASFEAIFQVDFHNRVAKKRKDPVSRKLRALRKRRKRE